jgi:hypothetical protein
MTGYVARVLMVIALVPLESTAQTLASAPAGSPLQASIAAIADQPSLLTIAPQPGAAVRSGPSRAGKIALGAGIGFGAGLVFGEYYIGRKLDTPHGPDMIIGGAMGAGAGALIAWLVTRNGATRSSSRTPLMPPDIHQAMLRTKAVSAPGQAGDSPGAITIAKPAVQSCDSL